MPESDPAPLAQARYARYLWWRRPIRRGWLDTNRRWLFTSFGVFLFGIAFHFTALAAGLYWDPPPVKDLHIDVYTHSVSSFGVIAILMNLWWWGKRRYYWGIPIGLAVVIGILWELFEEGAIRAGFYFYNTPWNAVQDVYIDVLGGMVAGFLVEPVVPETPDPLRADPRRSK